MTPEAINALPRPLAFVLPGGGALGAYQVGVIRALTLAGVAPDLLIGVSAGAVNASLFAWNQGPDGVRRIESVWRAIQRRDLIRFNPLRLALAVAGRRSSFLDNEPGRRFLRQQLGTRLLEHSPVPLVLVATDLATGRPVALQRGDATTAVLASAAFPGVYPPVEIDGRALIDGGVVADVPLDLASSLGAGSALVLSVPPTQDGRPPRHPIDILLRSSSLGVEAHGRTALQRPPDGLAVVEIPALPSRVNTFDVGRTADMIDLGAEATASWLRDDDGVLQ
ncbi:MAG: patatin-like phospholipase family protein [Acidobacteria bacterium]|nr:patatin-like phospholipase family protein [Acidobacteriota bacterium]